MYLFVVCDIKRAQIKAKLGKFKYVIRLGSVRPSNIRLA